MISCNLPRNEDLFPVRAYRVSSGERTGESFPQENLGSPSWLSIKRFGKSLVKSENMLLDELWFLMRIICGLKLSSQEIAKVDGLKLGISGAL